MAVNEIVIEMDQECVKFIKDKIGELKGRIDSANYRITQCRESKIDFEKRLEIYLKILDTLQRVNEEK